MGSQSITQGNFILTSQRFQSEGDLESWTGIPKKTWQNMRGLGKGPVYRKFGKAVRYDVGDVEAWINGLPTGGAGVPSCAVAERSC